MKLGKGNYVFTSVCCIVYTYTLVALRIIIHGGIIPIATNTCIPMHTVQVPPSAKARPSLVSTQHSLSVAAGTVPPVQLLSMKH